ncbi:MAG: nucleotidyltransferase domain-containing protein [Ignavibacteriaceae bacterium]
MQLTELDNFKSEIYLLANKFGVKNIKVFGSVARGDADDDSDIDFLVEMDKGRTLLDRIGFKQELLKILDCKVDVISIKAVKGRIKENILREAVSL